MKAIKTIILFSIIHLLFSNLLFSQDENYDAVYLKVSKIYTLNPDGSMDYNYVKKIKLQTYRSFSSLYGETFVVYNPEYQSLKINEVYTIMADGKKVSSPPNAFNEVLPGFAANAPLFNNLREMVITHPGTEIGAILYLDYTIHTQKGFFPALMGNEVLAESEPVKELHVTVRVPVGVKLNQKILNSDYIGNVTEEAGFDIFSWDFENVPAISAEENQKSGYDLYPRLIFSTARDRAALYNGFQLTAFSSIVNAGIKATKQQQPASEMKKAVEDIQKGNKEEIQVILKLQEKVVNEFRLWPVPLRYAGFKSRSAEEVWNSNGGTLSEKALLLISLLNIAGVSAEPVLVIRKSLYDEKVGSLLDIEDILVKAMPKTTDILYLSVSSLNPQNLVCGLPERVLVSLQAQNKQEIVNTKDYENKILCKATLTVTEKKLLTGEVSVAFNNNFNPWFALLRDQSKMKSYFGGFSASELKELKVITTGPEESYAKYTAEKEKPFHKDTNFYFYSLPYVSNGIDSWGIKTLPKTRLSSFEIPMAMEERYDLTYSLPEGMNLFTAETKTEISNKAGSFLFEVKKTGNQVKINRSIKLTKRIIEPSEYADFKALMDRWNSEKHRKITFTE